MKTMVLLFLVMFMLASCNSEEAKTTSAGTTSGSGTDSAATISGIDVKGLVIHRLNKAGVCTQVGGLYYRTHVISSDSGPNLYIQLLYQNFANITDCDNNNNVIDKYFVEYSLDKAVVVENGRIKLELTVDSHDADPSVGDFDAYNNNLTSVSNGQKEYWSIELDFAVFDSDVVLPRGQDFSAPSSDQSPNEGEETYVPITYIALA